MLLAATPSKATLHKQSCISTSSAYSPLPDQLAPMTKTNLTICGRVVLNYSLACLLIELWPVAAQGGYGGLRSGGPLPGAPLEPVTAHASNVQALSEQAVMSRPPNLVSISGFYAC